MQITVRSSKILKQGERKDGTPYTFLAVVAEDTGIEYTTFDKKALIGAGAVLDIGEPDIKEGKHSFKKVISIISEGTAPPVKANEERSDMTPEMWAEKDRLERWSRECNTCFMGIMEVASNRTPEDGKFKEAYNAALDWALAHFTEQVSSKQVIKTTSDEDFEKLGQPEPPEKVNIDLDLDFDSTLLLSELKEVKWKDGTVKSYCKNIYKTDKYDNLLDTNLDVVPFIASLKRADREAFFKEIADRKQML